MGVEVTLIEEKIMQESGGRGTQGFKAENTAKSGKIIIITYYNICNV